MGLLIDCQVKLSFLRGGTFRAGCELGFDPANQQADAFPVPVYAIVVHLHRNTVFLQQMFQTGCPLVGIIAIGRHEDRPTLLLQLANGNAYGTVVRTVPDSHRRPNAAEDALSEIVVILATIDHVAAAWRRAATGVFRFHVWSLFQGDSGLPQA